MRARGGTDTTHLRANGQRLWRSLMDMAAIGATPAGGNNRQALTDDDRRGRDLSAGANVWLQAMLPMDSDRG